MGSGLYVKLDASYEDDEKIIQAGEKAELLYVRSLCLVKRILSDGFVSDAHLPKFGLSSVNQRARKLAEVGLWDRDDERGGYWIRAWPKHNRSAADVKAQQTKAQQDAVLGNHRRWHQDTASPDCPHCYTDPDPPPDSPPESGTRSGPLSPETETEALSSHDGDGEADRVSLNGFGSGLPRQPAEGRSLAGTVQDWLAEPPREHHIRPRDKRSDDYRALIEGVCEHVDMRVEGRQVLDVVHRITCEYVAEVRGEPLSEVGAKQVRSFIGEYSKRPALALWGLAEAAMHGAGLTDEHAGNPQAFPNYARKVIESGLKAAS